jgi:hypothetical protein
MRRGIGLIAAALIAIAFFAMPARADSCVSGGAGPAAGQPGVVLGPATKCVRDGHATLPGTDSSKTKAGDVSTRPAPPPAPASSKAWMPLVVVAAFMLARQVFRLRQARSVRRAA